jgi:hypothetical protein
VQGWNGPPSMLQANVAPGSLARNAKAASALPVRPDGPPVIVTVGAVSSAGAAVAGGGAGGFGVGFGFGFGFGAAGAGGGVGAGGGAGAGGAGSAALAGAVVAGALSAVVAGAAGRTTVQARVAHRPVFPAGSVARTAKTWAPDGRPV